jgi:hypothetical protein
MRVVHAHVETPCVRTTTSELRCGSGSVFVQHCLWRIDDFVLDLRGDRLWRWILNRTAMNPQLTAIKPSRKAMIVAIRPEADYMEGVYP